MPRYDDMGRLIGPASQAEKDRIAQRIAREDAERERNARGWARLCGMAAPIGGPAPR